MRWLKGTGLITLSFLMAGGAAYFDGKNNALCLALGLGMIAVMFCGVVSLPPGESPDVD